MRPKRRKITKEAAAQIVEADRCFAMADAYIAAAKYALSAEFGHGDLCLDIAETFIKFARTSKREGYELFKTPDGNELFKLARP